MHGKGDKINQRFYFSVEKSKKASSYIAQYPVFRTVQSALHFTLSRNNADSSWQRANIDHRSRGQRPNILRNDQLSNGIYKKQYFIIPEKALSQFSYTQEAAFVVDS